MFSGELIILGIESSCDDTSCAVLRNGQMLSNVTASQEIHKQYGGVVPELASRDHQKNIVPVVDAALREANVKLSEISAIAFTRGPGLMGSLLVGTAFAKSFSIALEIPLIAVNHMQAHIMAHFIRKKENTAQRFPDFPFLCLTVSGGHTQIVKVKAPLEFELLGETLDDAVGEAFDKAAKIIGLPYPGGPLIDKHAQSGDPDRFTFSRSQVPGLNYSFSGIKTSFLYFIRDHVKEDPDFISKNLNDICASYQSHLIRVLLDKLTEAATLHNIRDIAIAGGVSANSGLRHELLKKGEEKGWNVFIPPFEFCTDNAAMIAICGHYKFLRGEFSGPEVTPLAVLPV